MTHYALVQSAIQSVALWAGFHGNSKGYTSSNDGPAERKEKLLPLGKDKSSFPTQKAHQP
jgi:hypothetical protein